VFDPGCVQKAACRSAPSIAIVTGNFVHEQHNPPPQVGILNSHERSDQP
jgi:hypothetical protein